jgi:hypothetical protein
VEVKVCYSPQVLECTVKYIAKHTRNTFYHLAGSGIEEAVRRSILDAVQDLIDRFPRVDCISRNGFYVWMSDYIEEGVEHDENIANIQFMVDPSLGADEYSFEFKDYIRKNHEPR